MCVFVYELFKVVDCGVWVCIFIDDIVSDGWDYEIGVFFVYLNIQVCLFNLLYLGCVIGIM